MGVVIISVNLYVTKSPTPDTLQRDAIML